MPLVPLTREFRASSRPLLNQAVNETQAPPGKKTALKRWLEETIDSNGVQIFLSVTLFVTLFLPDIWVVSNISNDNDFILNAVRARARARRARAACAAPRDGWGFRARTVRRADSPHIVRLLRDRNGMPVRGATRVPGQLLLLHGHARHRVDSARRHDVRSHGQ